jgi:plasmid stabilization system protein ParE
MGSRSAADSVDGERQHGRRGQRSNRRWERVDRDELDAIVTEVEEEDAAEQAAQASVSWLDAIGKVAAVLLRGASIATETHGAGVIESPDGPRWACVRVHDGSIIEVFHAVDEGRLDDRGPYAISKRERDWSAFGAARAFVDAVGVEGVMLALAGRGVARQDKQRPRESGTAVIIG